MKKIYALVALALATTAFGQRNLDVTLNLTTPLDGDTVVQSATQSIVFTVANSGDTLTVGDTLALYYFNANTQKTYSLTQQEGGVSFLALEGQLSQVVTLLNGGGTISSNQLQQGGLVLNTTATGFNVGDNIMVVVEVWGKNGEEEADPTFPDNFGKFVLKASGVSVSTVDAKSFSAYPNPTTATMTISAAEEVTSVSVMTLDGKTVFTTNGNVVNVSTLASGVYFYEATTVSGAKAINKFIKE